MEVQNLTYYLQQARETAKQEEMEAKEIEPPQTTTTWNRETVPEVMKIVSTKVPQRDLISLLLVSPWLYRTLTSFPPLWMVLDFREMNKAGDRLIAATSLPRYQHVKQINLEFAQDIEDKHLEVLQSKCSVSLQKLESLNLNGCQKISDKGIEAITSTCSKLKVFSIYWNVRYVKTTFRLSFALQIDPKMQIFSVLWSLTCKLSFRVTDIGIKHLVENCKHIVDLNLSGCKTISDKALQIIAENHQDLESLNLTRCVKLTDGGLQQILSKCSSQQSLNLYALSSLTDKTYKKISSLPHLKFLDLCGAQNLSDEGLSCIARCKNIVSLNLSWCVRVTDVGVVAIAEGCTSLEFLSLFGIVGVKDRCLEVLSRFCSKTVTTLDVNGCVGIKRRSRDELLQLFPRLRCFKVHS
ncbi:hypothetical protein OIU77_030898 [Salix suchowensis]|uniref:F-box/LRR-repeat protein 15-like leucin rich repeat domain-containing protein n=1 Tax=Salix suchowensis TaxID=1278906 RepID=A0ABQ9BGM0_9ROSI|nr:hypothetical protein OIU77_030898 [Salix suchowensis]